MNSAPTLRASLARGLLAGAAGGLAAGTWDAALSGGAAGVRLWLFLAGFYGALFALAGLAGGGAWWLLRTGTVLGALMDGDREAGVPARAAALAGVLGAAALGAAVYGPALTCLVRFHHRGLIAGLVGAVAAGLAVPMAALALLLLAGLARVPGLRRGPRLAARLRGPAGLYVVGWGIGLLLLGGSMAGVLWQLQLRPRMTPELRALNLALWTPALAIGAVALGHGLGRMLAARLPLPEGARGWLSGPAGGLVAGTAVLGLAAAGVYVRYADTLRLIDLRALAALGVAAVAVALAGLALRRWQRLWPALLVVPALWGVALGLGRVDRVRKAALQHTALCAPLLQGVQAVWDLDRDGFPSRWVIGGSDCDDLDPTINPAAFDWPGDGIDQNCNGQDAALPPAQVAPFPPLPPGVPARPNIVLITIDALRADHVGCYGYARPTTPNIDALAGEGVRFASAWAHAPSTRYSVPAILTGRYPSTIAWGPPARHWPPEVLPENRLVSEMLRDRGYHTIALLSYHYFEPTWGLARGFDDYDVHLMSLHSLGGDPAATSGSSARELADLAVGHIEAEAAHPERPFFLWVHFYDPHYRYEAHPGFVFGQGRGEADLYDGEIAYTDHHIGRVLEALRRTGQWQRTAVLLSADHGEGFGEHDIPPDKRHGYHLYAGQTKVPLLLRVPGLPPGTFGEAVGHVDIAPAILQLAGGRAEDEPQLAGTSLLALLASAPAGRAVFQEVMYEGPTTRKAVVTKDWHFIRNVVPDATSELYDLARDPAEDHDLQGRGLPSEEALSRRLAAWMDESAIPRDFAAKVAGNVSDRPIPAAQPIGARLGGWIEITGAEVRSGAEVRRGGTVEVAVVLHGLSRVPAGWRLFMHLRGGGTFVNADHDLLDGLMPLQQLRPGTYLRDVTKIAVPMYLPAGPAQVVLGLYRHGERALVHGPAAVADGAERVVRVATVQVR